MNETPNALRRHIGIFGSSNAGKSALFNKLINQDMAIVSDKKGTTTDPVKKAMELIGFGPVVFVDTAGLSDGTDLGRIREEKTISELKKVDFALLVADMKDYEEASYNRVINFLEKYNIPYSFVISKEDLLNESEKEKIKKEFKNSLFVSINNEESIKRLKEYIVESLKKLKDNKESMLDGIVKEKDDVVLVVPVDSEAPEGRLILPQVQTIRECLDIGAFCHICKEDGLTNMISSLRKTDLVITDSQIFKTVNEIVPKNIKLTSFSMLMAKKKGELKVFFDGVKAVSSLKDGDKILVAEVCTHSTSHEDIGKVKIPALLKKKTGKELIFEFANGFSFPKDLEKYSLIVHCGGCMITRRQMLSRISDIKEKNIPVVNYGVLLSYLTGAFERQKDVYEKGLF